MVVEMKLPEHMSRCNLTVPQALTSVRRLKILQPFWIRAEGTGNIPIQQADKRLSESIKHRGLMVVLPTD